MNSADLSKILEEHKVWITSMRESGSRANLLDADLRDANLRDADLRCANLCGANLRGANLRGADLRCANLCGANLRGADLCGANLRGADLCGANLYGADLYGADLRDANLRDADLRCANLRCANLCGANLRGADLCGANLYGADLPDLTFVILGEKYFISITNGEYVRAGCQNHTVEEWRKYSKQEIAEMDGRKALKFYPRLLDIIDFYIGKGERPDWLTSKEYADEVTE
ncbi:TPA: pentapeptide repeat-containing protein [Salmonella enterica]|uniref:Pentapeptide repeat-containing protein n=2 Tax=Salmonella enterica TaxID=28901 RepID=A0A760BVN5_SALER|nr:pentapeptide repeat-containing protein [Salmonella enterica]HAB5404112.1 pentapeptide repeat-containing protein [Salmonella enterica subsp. enterica serovar Mbandaka]EJJ0206330.1 pentapeptide repeat-containing protein [Salmonella enterica]EMD4469876.1 pentapeptide repeat-containing protein [Salmonella enterica]MCR4499844.1 pentapeptide repeat-containing protein [Salmonella enterica subsp. enterica serovar Ohio]HAG2294448.1 pentapeptide repeat-containing protein [Salmonella enterica]